MMTPIPIPAFPPVESPFAIVEEVGLDAWLVVYGKL
jgi:hypothetical protein